MVNSNDEMTVRTENVDNLSDDYNENLSDKMNNEMIFTQAVLSNSG